MIRKDIKVFYYDAKNLQEIIRKFRTKFSAGNDLIKSHQTNADNSKKVWNFQSDRTKRRNFTSLF